MSIGINWPDQNNKMEKNGLNILDQIKRTCKNCIGLKTETLNRNTTK